MYPFDPNKILLYLKIAPLFGPTSKLLIERFPNNMLTTLTIEAQPPHTFSTGNATIQVSGRISSLQSLANLDNLPKQNNVELVNMSEEVFSPLTVKELSPNLI
ncbi:UNVERIFIED_CONTAM: hypothetical protein NCL1_59339 [Trichonephila clavipes]